ncbi:hypothetical protein AN476_21070 [Phaeobacter sp. 11ANDIMAR09]|nr:hypothetical protein AN476_21070 [Phaeobacter sp. 11ANDIMAR09]
MIEPQVSSEVLLLSTIGAQKTLCRPILLVLARAHLRFLKFGVRYEQQLFGKTEVAGYTSQVMGRRQACSIQVAIELLPVETNLTTNLRDAAVVGA